MSLIELAITIVGFFVIVGAGLGGFVYGARKAKSDDAPEKQAQVVVQNMPVQPAQPAQPAQIPQLGQPSQPSFGRGPGDSGSWRLCDMCPDHGTMKSEIASIKALAQQTLEAVKELGDRIGDVREWKGEIHARVDRLEQDVASQAHQAREARNIHGVPRPR